MALGLASVLEAHGEAAPEPEVQIRRALPAKEAVIVKDTPAPVPVPAMTTSKPEPKAEAPVIVALAKPPPMTTVEPVDLSTAIKTPAPDYSTSLVRLPSPEEKAYDWQWRPLEDRVHEQLRLNTPDTGQLPLLYMAVLQDDPEWIAELIERGADPDETTPAGDTPLCAAIRHGSEAAVRALVEGGASVSRQGLEKQPPLALASLRRGPEILRILLGAGADPNTRFESPVSKELLARVSIKDLKNSLENDRGVTALIACCARGDVEGTNELLRAGAKSSLCTTRYKRYPINFAATQGYLFLMRIILGRQPESEPQILVTIDLSKQRAWVMKEGKIVDTCSVSTGRSGYATPAGRYVITDKHRSWVSTLYHVPMPFFMRLNCGAIGLHSGYVTGRPASHGCIRLPYEKAKKFFEICRVGDEVQIVH
jgi:hypothetical protein